MAQPDSLTVTRTAEMHGKLIIIRNELEVRVREFEGKKETLLIGLGIVLFIAIIGMAFSASPYVLAALIAGCFGLTGAIFSSLYKYYSEQVSITMQKIQLVDVAIWSVNKFYNDTNLRDECFEKVEKFLA